MAEPDSAGLLDADASRDVKLKSFSADELLTCDVCLRANPPTRAACIYCGAALTSGALLPTPRSFLKKLKLDHRLSLFQLAAMLWCRQKL